MHQMCMITRHYEVQPKLDFLSDLGIYLYSNFTFEACQCQSIRWEFYSAYNDKCMFCGNWMDRF